MDWTPLAHGCKVVSCSQTRDGRSPMPDEAIPYPPKHESGIDALLWADPRPYELPIPYDLALSVPGEAVR
jgi:hypothetical protein